MQNISSWRADSAKLCSACQEEPVPQAKKRSSDADGQPKKALHISFRQQTPSALSDVNNQDNPLKGICAESSFCELIVPATGNVLCGIAIKRKALSASQPEPKEEMRLFSGMQRLQTQLQQKETPRPSHAPHSLNPMQRTCGPCCSRMPPSCRHSYYRIQFVGASRLRMSLAPGSLTGRNEQADCCTYGPIRSPGAGPAAGRVRPRSTVRWRWRPHRRCRRRKPPPDHTSPAAAPHRLQAGAKDMVSASQAKYAEAGP